METERKGREKKKEGEKRRTKGEIRKKIRFKQERRELL